MTMTNGERTAALRRLDADLMWLYLPMRPECPTCRGERTIGEGVQRKVCPRCDGIGSVEPTDRRSPMTIAHQLLLDGELQAAVIRAQRPEGASHPTEGSTAWSDPTGERAASTTAVELRASEIRSCWHAEITAAVESVDAICELVGVHRVAITRPGLAHQAIADLLRIPTRHLERAIPTLSEGEVDQLDHSITFGAARTAAVRHGQPDAGGKRAPSVMAVITQADRITEAAPPAPKQKPLAGCLSCARDDGHFSPIDVDRYNARHLCRVCGDYASGEGEWPPLGAIAQIHRTGKPLTWKLIEEHKRAERRRRASA